MSGPVVPAVMMDYQREAMEDTFTAACIIYRLSDPDTDEILTAPYVKVGDSVCSVELYDPVEYTANWNTQNFTDDQPRWISLPNVPTVQKGYEIDVGATTYAVQDTSTDDTDPYFIVARCNIISPTPTRPA